MTSIYRPSIRDDYEWLFCVDDDHYEVFSNMDGTPQLEGWRPVPVERYPGDDGLDKPSDFPWFGAHVLAMRRRAVDALCDMLEAGGELLPLATDDGVELHALNVTRVIDALDEERSLVDRFPDDGAIFYMTEAVFHEPLVRDVDFFWLPMRASDLFVGQRFVDRVTVAGLEGLEFELVWSRDGGPVRQ